MITLTWLLIIALIGGALTVVDGVLRLRGRGGSTIIAIVEIVVGALFLLSLFLPAIPWGSIVLAIVAMIALVVALVMGRRGRGLAIGALVVLAIWFILVNRWLVIPGVN
ncbi:MAG: hypothetical protein K0S05_2555 [Agromyces sp.]|jgi:hypothetical protein|nr:hypothetical protein [Agromyces sp.]